MWAARSAGWLVGPLAALAALVLLTGPATAQKDKKIKVTVVVILASERSPYVDPRLKCIADEVRKLNPGPAGLHRPLVGLPVCGRGGKGRPAAGRGHDRGRGGPLLRRQEQPRHAGRDPAPAGRDRLPHRLRQVPPHRDALPDAGAHPAGGRGRDPRRLAAVAPLWTAAGGGPAGRGPHARPAHPRRPRPAL